LSVVLIMYVFFCPREAYAYLDPGTGSYIFQLLIAGLLGGLLAVKIFWASIKKFFLNLFSGKKTDDHSPEL